MKRVLVSLLLVCQLSSPLYARGTRQKTLAITHVTVIDATGAPPRPDMTVVIVAGRIKAIGKSARARIPKEAEVVDAAGKFLVPGLWDMHAHLGDEDFDRSAYLKLFLANGVTGLRIMEGAPQHHLWRGEIEGGALLGPRMVIASRIIDGPNSFLSDAVIVSNEREAREAVRRARQEGADFVKVYDNLSRESYFALIDEAERLGLPVAGHLPTSITAEEAARAGQKSIEHLTGMGAAESSAALARKWLAAFKLYETWQCPTLIMRHNYALLNDTGLARDPRLKYVKPSWRRRWLRMTREAEGWKDDESAKRKEIIRREDALVGRMQRAGVGLLAGTDDANPYVMPGFSLHDELALLVGAGLTPMQALQSATLNAAKFLGRLDTLGTIEKGKIADFVLLDANPLEDIHNTRKINAVVINGRLLDRSALDEILSRIEAAASKD